MTWETGGRVQDSRTDKQAPPPKLHARTHARTSGRSRSTRCSRLKSGASTSCGHRFATWNSSTARFSRVFRRSRAAGLSPLISGGAPLCSHASAAASAACTAARWAASSACSQCGLRKAGQPGKGKMGCQQSLRVCGQLFKLWGTPAKGGCRQSMLAAHLPSPRPVASSARVQATNACRLSACSVKHQS